jgi:hypothetical protein
MFALYEQYGVPLDPGPGIDMVKTEAAMSAAYDADPQTLRPIFNAEITHYQPFVDRDYASRTYVALLRRCMGEAVDLEAQHAEKMRAALDKLNAAKS